MKAKAGSAQNQAIVGVPRREPTPWWRRMLSRTRTSFLTTLERTLHPRRRRLAQRQLRGREAPKSVLFVCEGNIYRSPYAAACLSAMMGPNGTVRIASAGFKGSDRACPTTAQVFARSRGYDLSAHRSRLLSAISLAEWDLVVVMDEHQARRLSTQFGTARARLLVLGDLDPAPIDRRGIADPWQASERVLARSYARVERCVREFADSCWGSRPAAG
jgi:protein-tyrosine phosphatase